MCPFWKKWKIKVWGICWSLLSRKSQDTRTARLLDTCLEDPQVKSLRPRKKKRALGHVAVVLAGERSAAVALGAAFYNSFLTIYMNETHRRKKWKIKVWGTWVPNRGSRWCASQYPNRGSRWCACQRAEQATPGALFDHRLAEAEFEIWNWKNTWKQIKK